MPRSDESDCRCKNMLSLDKLCCEKAKIEKLKVCHICADKVESFEICADSICANKICSVDANFNTLTVQNWHSVTKYRATVNFLTNTTYTLGSDLNFDNIVDDPNGNISFSPTKYTAPKSGYYMLTYKVNATNLVTTPPVLGIPVANLDIYVNGLLARDMFTPFLSFFPSQKSVLSSLITLTAGDIVTMKYDILGANGIPLVGTVDIEGNGLELGASLFKIILLTELDGGVIPPPCPPVVIDCDPCCDRL